jgi:hypothetical protein
MPKLPQPSFNGVDVPADLRRVLETALRPATAALNKALVIGDSVQVWDPVLVTGTGAGASGVASSPTGLDSGRQSFISWYVPLNGSTQVTPTTGQTWTWGNGGTDSAGASTHGTDDVLPYFTQGVNTNGYLAAVDTSADGWVAARQRPKISFLAKFNTATSNVSNNLGWVRGGTWDYVTWGYGSGREGARFTSGTTNWVAETSDGTASTTIDTGVSFSDGKWHTFSIDYSDATKIVFRIDGAIVATSTTHLPLSSGTGGNAAVTSGWFGTSGAGEARLYLSRIDYEIHSF